MEITINWSAFIQVIAASLSFTTLIVAFFSVGIRLLTNAQNLSDLARGGDSKAQQWESVNLVGAYGTFAVCICALAYGIYLVVPFLPH